MLTASVKLSFFSPAGRGGRVTCFVSASALSAGFGASLLAASPAAAARSAGVARFGRMWNCSFHWYSRHSSQPREPNRRPRSLTDVSSYSFLMFGFGKPSETNEGLIVIRVFGHDASKLANCLQRGAQVLLFAFCFRGRTACAGVFLGLSGCEHGGHAVGRLGLLTDRRILFVLLADVGARQTRADASLRGEFAIVGKDGFDRATVDARLHAGQPIVELHDLLRGHEIGDGGGLVGRKFLDFGLQAS